MVSQGIDIRSGKPADGEIIAALLMAQLAEHSIDTPADAVRRAVEGMLANADRGFILIAVRGAAVLGVAYVSFTWTLEHGGKSAWLEELYVLPGERNRGIGRAIVEAVIYNARAAGCAGIDLEVERSHARAEHLYSRAGFTPLRRARWLLAFPSTG
jgi:GNAT superfamily N-acetyltransferase